MGGGRRWGLRSRRSKRGDTRKPVADYVVERDDERRGPTGTEWLQTHRVELNAMTTPELIEWLDDKMETHGDGKLIPPEDVLVDELMAETEKRLRAEITARILREAGLEAQVAAAYGGARPARWRRRSSAASPRCSRTSRRPTGAPISRRSRTT